MYSDMTLYVHHLIFKNKCLEESATGFQNFFEHIMTKANKDFVPVKPAGREGDWKCDGFSRDTGTVYQCYSPETPNTKRTTNKIIDDFDGAKAHWAGKMKRWIFVYGANLNHLPPLALDTLENIKKNNRNIIIETWGHDALWEIVKELDLEQRNELLGFVPSPLVATEVTSAELEVLMDYLVHKSAPTNGDDMILTYLADKILKNKLKENIEPLIKNSVGISAIVESYLKKHPDSLYSSKIANALILKYSELQTKYPDEPEAIYWQLIEYVKNEKNGPKSFWAASGIVTYYFQLCDIFEK